MDAPTPAEFAVECDAAGEPLRLGFGRGWQRVEEIVDRWWGEGYRYLRLRTADGARWIVRHDEPAGRWTLVQFEVAGIEPPGRSDGGNDVPA